MTDQILGFGRYCIEGLCVLLAGNVFLCMVPIEWTPVDTALVYFNPRFGCTDDVDHGACCMMTLHSGIMQAIPEGLIQKQDPEDALISRAW